MVRFSIDDLLPISRTVRKGMPGGAARPMEFCHGLTPADRIIQSEERKSMNRILSISVVVAHGTLSSQLLINQVQLGGSSSSLDEFVELFNSTSSPISLAGYRLRYFSAGGVNSGNCDIPTDSPFSVPAKGFFLIASSAYDWPGASYDCIWTGGYSSTSGQIGLFNGLGQLVDGLAYGVISNNLVGEGSPSSVPPSDQSLIRTPDGSDTDDNAADFKISVVPDPRNSQSTPLPIQLSTFTARWDHIGQNVLVQWKTVSETNNYGFEVERTRDGQQAFQVLTNGFVAGHGTTAQEQEYSYADKTATSGDWSYRLNQIDLDGTAHYTESVHVDFMTSVWVEARPAAFSLNQNYPNPFNPSTTIRYGLPARLHVSLTLFTTLGQDVATLVQGEQDAGYHEVRFDASGMASGVYFCRMQAGAYVESRKLLLIR
jgi:hypothetical protein